MKKKINIGMCVFPVNKGVSSFVVKGINTCEKKTRKHFVKEC